MNESRLADYLSHMQQAATDACSFIEGLSQEDFVADKRTQQAIIMSLIIIGEAATKLMDRYSEFADAHSTIPWRSMRGCEIASPTAISTSTLVSSGAPCRRPCRNC